MLFPMHGSLPGSYILRSGWRQNDALANSAYNFGLFCGLCARSILLPPYVRISWSLEYTITVAKLLVRIGVSTRL